MFVPWLVDVYRFVVVVVVVVVVVAVAVAVAVLGCVAAAAVLKMHYSQGTTFGSRCFNQ